MMLLLLRLLLLLRPGCSWRRPEARARERAPASWDERASEEKKRREVNSQKRFVHLLWPPGLSAGSRTNR